MPKKWEAVETYTNETNPASDRTRAVVEFESDSDDPWEIAALAHSMFHGCGETAEHSLNEARAFLKNDLEDDQIDADDLTGENPGIGFFWFDNDGRYDMEISPVAPGLRQRSVTVKLTWEIKSDQSIDEIAQHYASCAELAIINEMPSPTWPDLQHVECEVV